MQHASVLLIEPDDDNRTMYAEFLRREKFVCLTAETAEDGLLFANMVDVVITGIRLRGAFDGVELVRRLRQKADTRQTPIIVLTAAVFEPDRLRALGAGCDVFLPKPCLPEHLASTVRRTLKGRLERRAS